MVPTYLELAYNGNYVGRWPTLPEVEIFTYKGKVYSAITDGAEDDVIELQHATVLFA